MHIQQIAMFIPIGGISGLHSASGFISPLNLAIAHGSKSGISGSLSLIRSKPSDTGFIDISKRGMPGKGGTSIVKKFTPGKLGNGKPGNSKPKSMLGIKGKATGIDGSFRLGTPNKLMSRSGGLGRP
ncbi:MAG: hypothetical protein HOK72_07570, partial [Flavobacteriales bacterium]|nr:hypothetical protein [Flavobacteriales bacterium]